MFTKRKGAGFKTCPLSADNRGLKKGCQVACYALHGMRSHKSEVLLCLRELFASKSLIVALIGCGLLIVGIHFWSQHEHSKLRRDEAETRRFIQQVAAEKHAATTRADEPFSRPQPHEATNAVQDAHRTPAQATGAIPVQADAVEVADILEEDWMAQERGTSGRAAAHVPFWFRRLSRNPIRLSGTRRVGRDRGTLPHRSRIGARTGVNGTGLHQALETRPPFCWCFPR